MGFGRITALAIAFLSAGGSALAAEQVKAAGQVASLSVAANDIADVLVMATSTEKNNNTSPTAASASTDLNGTAASLKESGADWITFTSSSTVEHFHARFDLPAHDDATNQRGHAHAPSSSEMLFSVPRSAGTRKSPTSGTTPCRGRVRAS